MKNLSLIAVLGCVVLSAPAEAQTRLNSVSGPGPTFAYPGMTYTTPGGSTMYNPMSPYAPYSPTNPMNNPYAYPGYGGYGGYGGYAGGGYGVPTALNNGFYRFGQNLNMWRSPSGYYYPWGGGYSTSTTTILYGAQTGQAPQAQQPPIATMIRDMVSYIDDCKTKNRIDDADYTHLRRRVMDLQSKESLLLSNGNGALDPQDEQQLRRDLDGVSREITQAVKPVQ
jgi:hypothetical protein